MTEKKVEEKRCDWGAGTASERKQCSGAVGKRNPEINCFDGVGAVGSIGIKAQGPF